jgi:hypothetical protein
LGFAPSYLNWKALLLVVDQTNQDP